MQEQFAEPEARRWVRPLCWSAVLLDGFDLVVLGTITPVLLSGKVFGYTPATAATVATVGLVGMMLGGLLIGTVTDVIGRRRALLIAVASFSVFTLLCAFAPSAGVLGLLRFLAGLGLGGCLPTAITLVTEYSPAWSQRRSDHADHDRLPRRRRTHRPAGDPGDPVAGLAGDVRDRRRARAGAAPADAPSPAGIPCFHSGSRPAWSR